MIYQPIAILSILGIAIYSIVVRATSEKEFFHCWILESLYLIFLVSLIFYIALHVYFFIVIIEYYLELKANEPAPAVEEPEVTVVKEEELQLLETPKVENADETDKAEGKLADEEKTKEETKASKVRCPELPKCPSLKCPSWATA